MVEVAAVQGRANASLAAGYGFTGILVAFLARQNPLAIIPVAILLGGIGASGGLLQRRLDLPDATVLVLQGIIFVVDPGQRDALRPPRASSRPGMPRRWPTTALGLWGVPLAMLGGAIRVSTPFLFVSLGECLTERSGRINLGLEGTLVMGAMSGYGIALSAPARPGSACSRRAPSALLLGALHAAICKLPRVNDIAIGIALMLFGTGLAFYLGKPLIQPTAPHLPAHRLRLVERRPAGPRRRCRSTACSSSASCWRSLLAWALDQHALGPDRAHWPARAPTRRAPWATRSTRVRLLATMRRRLPRRHRRLVPVALLSRAAGTRACRAARA